MVLKILSYNIHKGRAFFSRKNIWSAIDDLIHFVDADIVFLQEFLKDKDSEELLEKFADKLWPHNSFGQNATMSGFEYGNVILSKFPFKKTYNIDISTNILEKRGLLYGTVDVGGTDLHLLCTHLNLTSSGRKKQTEKIKKFIQQEISNPRPILLAGDFNDWDCDVHRKLKKELNLKEVFEETGGHLMPTSPSVFPILSLDRIYYSGMNVSEAQCLQGSKYIFLSDHLPITSTFHISER